MDTNQLLEKALEKEKEAQRFYAELAEKLSDPAAVKICQQFSEEEGRHVTMVQKLMERVEELDTEKVEVDPVQNLKIGDYLQDKPISYDASFQDILIYIMKREQKAYEFYQFFAAKATDRKLKNVLELLATEERKHKLMVETEYDNIIYREN